VNASIMKRPIQSEPLRKAHFEAARDLTVGRQPLLRCRHIGDRPFGRLLLGTEVARYRIKATEVVHDGPSDAMLRERAEGRAGGRVEPVRGLHQADVSGADQVVECYVARKPLAELMGDGG
jgi:hypothetical protein